MMLNCWSPLYFAAPIIHKNEIQFLDSTSVVDAQGCFNQCAFNSECQGWSFTTDTQELVQCELLRSTEENEPLSYGAFNPILPNPIERLIVSMWKTDCQDIPSSPISGDFLLSEIPLTSYEEINESIFNSISKSSISFSRMGSFVVRQGLKLFRRDSDEKAHALTRSERECEFICQMQDPMDCVAYTWQQSYNDIGVCALYNQCPEDDQFYGVYLPEILNSADKSKSSNLRGKGDSVLWHYDESPRSEIEILYDAIWIPMSFYGNDEVIGDIGKVTNSERIHTFEQYGAKVMVGLETDRCSFPENIPFLNQSQPVSIGTGYAITAMVLTSILLLIIIIWIVYHHRNKKITSIPSQSSDGIISDPMMKSSDDNWSSCESPHRSTPVRIRHETNQ